MKLYNPGDPCKYNPEVRCTERHKCPRCGWNPEVSKKRVAAIAEKVNEERRAARGKHN